MRVNLVGRSLVSAITHTPASAPFLPVTTPARSEAPGLTAAPFGCAPAGAGAKPAAVANAAAAAPKRKCWKTFEAMLCAPAFRLLLYADGVAAHLIC